MAEFTTRERVQRHREKMRKAGFRPVQVWVPDVRDPMIRDMAFRACMDANAAPRAREDMDFVESLSDDLD
jgi:hypothetical protein